ncbi:unnamed protein product [Moneuplotes crassus]|uniref:WD repeat-containing protein 67 n=1 Tax=Euplotes crassus TaxID=5936 RepID=A0AAD2DAG8_EUPCR|nr:unnamed protein product [Moneuplotes crassus]
MTTISIVNFSGRLFDHPVKPKEDGFVTQITYQDAVNTKGGQVGSTRAQGVSFNDTGDQFAISDSRGCITVYYISQNRYMAIAKDAVPSRKLKFISGLKQDQVIAANDNFSLSIYGMKGKLLKNIRGHRSQVTKFLLNTKHSLILSHSKDVINLWDREKYTKVRSIFAHNNSFKDCKFTVDSSMVCTLFKDSTIYFWSIGKFTADYKITNNPKELQLGSIDCSTKYLACGGKTPYLVVYDIEQFFSVNELPRRIFKLPEGYERGISKLHFLKEIHPKNGSLCKLAILASGTFIIVDIPEGKSQYDDSNSEDLKKPENPLRILASIRLPNCSILDFDIDRNCYFVSLLTSEGNVELYDIATLEKSECKFAKKKLKSSSRGSISHHKSFGHVTEKEFENDIKNYSAFLPEEGILSKNSVRMKDSGFMDCNGSLRKSEGLESRIGSAYKPHLEPPNKINYKELNTLNSSRVALEDLKSGKGMKSRFDDSSQKLFSEDLSARAIPQSESNILIYKEGVPDMQDYGSFINEMESQGNTNKNKHSKPFNPRTNRKSVSIQIDGGKMSISKLKPILRKYSEYPEKYRKSIWQSILQCPENKLLGDSLCQKINPAFEDLRQTYKISSDRIYNKLVKTLSGLANWCPLFAEVAYLPDLVFPFVQTIKHDDNALFEIVLTFLAHFCQLWFEKYPSDPIHLLKTSVEVIIAKESMTLINHFVSHGFGVAEYAWPLLKNAFSVVLSKDDWLSLFDNVFTYQDKPELLFYFTAAYLLYFKNTLTKITTVEQMLSFTQKQNSIQTKIVMKEALKLYKKYNEDDEVLIGTFGNYIPVHQEGKYITFSNYPTENVAYAKQIRLMKLNEEEIKEHRQKEVGELRNRVSKLLLKDKQVREQTQTISEQESRKAQQKQIELEEQILLKLKEQSERTEYLRKLEENLRVTVEKQKEQKCDDQTRLIQEYEERKKIFQYEEIMQKQEKDLSQMEKNAALRIHDIISMRQKEEYERQINQHIENHPFRGLLDKPGMDDTISNRDSISSRPPLSKSSMIFENNQQSEEIDNRMRKLEEEMRNVRVDKERRLKQIESDYAQASEQMKAEISKKNEYLKMLEQMNNYEIDYRSQALNEISDGKIKELLDQKKEIENSLKNEKHEQIRLQKAIEKKHFEQQLMKLNLLKEEQKKDEEARLQEISKEMEHKKREWELIDKELSMKEKEIIEKEKFKDLLKETDQNLLRIEEEKLAMENQKLQQNVNEVTQKAYYETQSKVSEIMKEREINFQEYTLLRQQQIHKKYEDRVKEIEEEHKAKEIAREQQIKNIQQEYQINNAERDQSISVYERDDKTDRDNSKERNPVISPEKEELSYIQNHPQEESKSYYEEAANINLNMYRGPLSDLNSSMNQKYQNENVYERQRNDGNAGTLKDQMKAIKGVLSQPASEENEGFRYDIQSITSEAPSRMNDSYSSIEDDPALVKHEQSKQAFEAYKNTYNAFGATEDYSLQLRESTFGNPTASSKEFQRITTTKPTSQYGDPKDSTNEGYEIRSYYMGGDGRISSAITEENDDGSTSSQLENISQTSSMSSQNYPDYVQEKSYTVDENAVQSTYNKSMVKSYNSNIISPPQEYMKSPVDSSLGTSEISSTSSDAENQNPNVAHYPPEHMNVASYDFSHSKEIGDGSNMPINPFYNPNPAFSSSYGFKPQ